MRRSFLERWRLRYDEDLLRIVRWFNDQRLPIAPHWSSSSGCVRRAGVTRSRT